MGMILWSRFAYRLLIESTTFEKPPRETAEVFFVGMNH